MFKTIAYLKPIILCLAVVVFSSCQPKSDFQYLSGQTGSLSDFKGQWLIVNFWAEWCSPCRKEVEVLSNMVKNSKDSSVAVIGISYDPLHMVKLKDIVEEWRFNYPIIATDPVPILPFQLPNKLPALYILSPKSELVAKVSGEQTLESINKLLNSLKKNQE